MMNTTVTWAKLPRAKQTKKQRIAHLKGALDLLEREIVALRERIAALEARPVTPYPWQPLPIYPVPGPSGPYIISDTKNTEPFLKAFYGVAGGTYSDPRHTEGVEGGGK